MTYVWEEASFATGMQEQHKGPRPETAAMSRKQEEIEQDLQEDHRAGDRKANSQDLHWTSKNDGWTLWRGRPPLNLKRRPHTE
jgi:hypothetical protein